VSTLERAIAIAAEAHAGQVDKAGAPYVLHPLRMMLRMSSIDERIVAVRDEFHLAAIVQNLKTMCFPSPRLRNQTTTSIDSAQSGLSRIMVRC
jgi:hypothetical protein